MRDPMKSNDLRVFSGNPANLLADHDGMVSVHQTRYQCAFHIAINHGEQLKDAQSSWGIMGYNPQNDHGIVGAMSADK